jgi:demethylsterigmatocystin 6-O-methyltransferase
MRNILHDYPDEKCLVILANCINAMDADSRILIDEMVLPNQGVAWQAAQLDLTMMAALGAKERTIEQWYTLLDSAGLKVVEIEMYEPALQDSVIMAVPK